MALSDLSDRQRRAGQWLVGLFFLVTAGAFLTAGEGIVGYVRGVVSALLFLSIAVVSIPPTREFAFAATDRYLAPGELVFAVVGTMLVAILIAPPP